MHIMRYRVLHVSLVFFFFFFFHGTNFFYSLSITDLILNPVIKAKRPCSLKQLSLVRLLMNNSWI